MRNSLRTGGGMLLTFLVESLLAVFVHEYEATIFRAAESIYLPATCLSSWRYEESPLVRGCLRFSRPTEVIGVL